MEAAVGDEVIAVLRDRFGPVAQIGAGAWSTAFRFDLDGAPMVVRVGEHVDDFEIDAEMSAFGRPDLPVPKVTEVSRLEPPHDHLHICISTFAPGTPLEYAAREHWAELVPKVADLLNALRAVSPPAGLTVPSWTDVLCAENDNERGRMAGWRDRLAERPAQHDMYERARAQLRSLCAEDAISSIVPTLLHCDLINRNVHVEGGRITGVFDWGCRRWGDHLFDFAWFVFWDPWMETLDVGLLKAELVKRWGEEPHGDRLRACLLQIGADHLAYNAFAGDHEGGQEVMHRIDELGLLTS